MKCKFCKDTGVIETGNNDLPCDCVAGETALFNSAMVPDGPITGAQLKNHFLNDSPDPIYHVITKKALEERDARWKDYIHLMDKKQEFLSKVINQND